jgi:hypothetical protein
MLIAKRRVRVRKNRFFSHSPQNFPFFLTATPVGFPRMFLTLQALSGKGAGRGLRKKAERRSSATWLGYRGGFTRRPVYMPMLALNLPPAYAPYLRTFSAACPLAAAEPPLNTASPLTNRKFALSILSSFFSEIN